MSVVAAVTLLENHADKGVKRVRGQGRNLLARCAGGCGHKSRNHAAKGVELVRGERRNVLAMVAAVM